MLKTIHFVAGAAAVLLSFVPGQIAYLAHPDALYLTFLGLAQLLIAPLLPRATRPGQGQLQAVVCALLVVATIIQALVALAPLPTLGEQPAVLLTLAISVVAVLLHIAINRTPSHKPRPARAVHTSSAPRSSESGRESGTVKWFNTSKGFGFISRDSGEDIFVHFRAIRGDGHRVLQEGQRVEFTVMQREKGLQAEDVVAH